MVGNLSLTPEDIKAFPALIDINVEPLLPQNLISEGQFWDRMHARGHITRRTHLQTGLRIQQPEQEIRNRLIEDIQDALKPFLVEDVLTTVGVIQPQPTGLVGPDGKTPVSGPKGPPGPTGGGNGAGRSAIEEIMKSMGGYTRAGQPRQPPEEAGAFPPGQTEEES